MVLDRRRTAGAREWTALAVLMALALAAIVLAVVR